MPMCLATVEAYRYMCDKLNEEITIGGERVVRRDLLIGRIKTDGLTYIKIAEQLGVTPRTIMNKMKNGDFSCREAEVIADMLGLTDKDLIDIFFNKRV